jgi:type VI protein secretion system component VasK
MTDPVKVKQGVGALRVAIVIVGIGIVSALRAVAQTPPAGDPMVRLGPDVWFVIAGVLVTVGINLEQLRRVRSDMRDVKTAREKDEARIDERHEENRSNFKHIDRRLVRIEATLRVRRLGEEGAD